MSKPLSTLSRWLPALLLGCGVGTAVQAQSDTIYECPGRSFTNMITPQEAATRGCKVSSKVQAVITVPGGAARAATSSSSTRTASAPVAVAPPPNLAQRPDTRVDPAEQRARDSDARRILEAELRKEEERLAVLQKDFNGGEPERQGGERNYARYLERVSEMKSAITRKESDIAALKRELAKVP